MVQQRAGGLHPFKVASCDFNSARRWVAETFKRGLPTYPQAGLTVPKPKTEVAMSKLVVLVWVARALGLKPQSASGFGLPNKRWPCAAFQSQFPPSRCRAETEPKQ